MFTRLCFEGSPLWIFGQSRQTLPDPVAGAAHQFRAGDPAQVPSSTKACAIASVAIFFQLFTRVACTPNSTVFRLILLPNRFQRNLHFKFSV
jgi:hypothetical protein